MCYFDNATRRTQVTVNNICHELKNPKLGKVDLVVGIGFSGILLLAAIHIQSGDTVWCYSQRQEFNSF